MVDLPLIDEDAGVFGNEVAIKRCVFWCARKEEHNLSPLHIYFFSITHSYIAITALFFSENLAAHQ